VHVWSGPHAPADKPAPSPPGPGPLRGVQLRWPDDAGPAAGIGPPGSGTPPRVSRSACPSTTKTGVTGGGLQRYRRRCLDRRPRTASSGAGIGRRTQPGRTSGLSSGPRSPSGPRSTPPGRSARSTPRPGTKRGTEFAPWMARPYREPLGDEQKSGSKGSTCEGCKNAAQAIWKYDPASRPSTLIWALFGRHRRRLFAGRAGVERERQGILTASTKCRSLRGNRRPAT